MKFIWLVIKELVLDIMALLMYLSAKWIKAFIAIARFVLVIRLNLRLNVIQAAVPIKVSG